MKDGLRGPSQLLACGSLSRQLEFEATNSMRGSSRGQRGDADAIREPIQRADRPRDVCLIGAGRTPLRNGSQRLHARLEDGAHIHCAAVEALRPLEVSDRVWHRPGP
jgi:hypothetical protein